MTTSAIVMMVSVQLSVTIITIYFFLKVLRAPKKSEPNSYTEDDDPDV